MKRIFLHGSLKRYAPYLDLDVATVGEAVRALCVNFPSIQKVITDGKWHVIRGDLKKKHSLGEEDILNFKVGNADIHIMPALSGRKNKGGVLKTILGVALIAVSFGAAPWLATAVMGGVAGGTTWGAALGMVGLSMAISGVSSMLAPEAETEGNTKSFLLSGPTGNIGQGGAVPLVYGGPLITGSTMISGGIDIDKLEVISDGRR